MKNQSIKSLQTYDGQVVAKSKNKMQYFVLKSSTLILMLLATLLPISQTHAQKIAAGYWHSLFICSDSGIPKSNGSNSSGQLGDGTTISKPTPLQVSGLSGITAMAGGHSFSLFLKSDSTVWACGNNVYGNLGDGTNINSSYPVQVIGLTGITAIAAGASFSLFLKSDSTVWACGENSSGQLGDGTTINRNIPVQVSWLTGITAISAGWYNSLFLKKNGTVYACGSNSTGQLGDGTTIAKLTPVQVSSLTGIKAIASGGTFSLFLKSAGTIWACGFNDNGELGDGTTIARLTPVKVIGLNGITAIEAGTSHSLFLKSNTNVYACGYNGDGRLGDGTIINRTTAVQVSGLTGVTAIGGGHDHSLFLKSDGTVWACGNNYHGQFGDGTTTNSLIPIQTLNSFPFCQNGGTSNAACGCDCPVGTSGTLCETIILHPPTITSFSPSSGPVGTLVTITGTNLNTPTSIIIGGVNAIPISNTGTSLVAMVMPGAVNGKIVVTTVSGSDSSAINYNVTASVPPTAQQGNKLVGTGSTTTAYQGYSVSISADGNTAIVGGYLDNSGEGAVWAYTRTGGVWSQQGNKLVGTGDIGGASQGSSVSLSADGNTALIGGHTDSSNQGAVWVFKRNAGVWSQQGNKLVGTGGTAFAYQGLSVSLSADGNTALVGGFYDSNQQGAAWVFTQNGGVWNQQGAKLVGTGSIGFSHQGNSVSLSADGNTALVGGNGDNNNLGAAWVFARSGGLWIQQGNKLTGLGSSAFATFGSSVSLSADGNTAIVGAPGDNNNIGAAWVYSRNAGIWSQQGSKIVGTGAVGTANQGNAVSISADGNTLMLGGAGDNNSIGATWVYKRNAGIWSQHGNKLAGSGSSLNPVLQGSSVSISADGNTSIWGGFFDNNKQGAAWVFVGAACTPATLTTSQTNISCVPNNLTGTATVTALGGTSPYTYLWSNAATTATVTGLAAGTYTVTVTATGGCTATTSVSITVIPLQAPVITGSLSLCSGGSTTLNAGVYASYLWSTGATTQSINVSTASVYTVTVTSGNGCTASNSATTKIENFHELWSNNPAVNMAICTATNNQAEPKAVSDGLGGAIITWYDSRNGIDKDIYAQRIDAAGLIKWTLNGLAICNAIGDQTFPKIAADASGGAIITWQDYRSGNQWDVYAQRVNAAGTIMWAANGVAICSAINNQLAPNIINDSKGGVILTWSDFRNGATDADIYAQRITDLGVIKWSANGVPVCSAINNQTAPVLVTNGSGGAMIAWSDFRNGNADIYMQRINTNGIIQWTIDGLPISFLPAEINKVALVSDNASGAIVTWEDYRNGTSNADIYAQRINATGVALWSTNGVSVCNSAGNQFQPAIISDGGKGAILTWRDKRNSSFDIYAQKIDSMGVGLWTNNGSAICTFLENQSNPALVADIEGGAFITWQDYRSTNFDIYAQKVNSAGVNQFTTNGIVIGNAPNSQQYPFIISDNNGGAIVTWNDSDIYAQNINANGTLGSNFINPTVPVTSASSYTNCGVINTTLSIASGSLNSATNWQWYSGSCGGTPVGTGTSVMVNPAASTTYFVRGESSCVPPGSCASVTITVIKPKPIGLTSNNITAASAIVKWDTVACAVGYKMQYRKQGVTAWTTLNINANTPTKTISGLLAATTYQWRVKSKFADGTFSTNSATATFTTLVIRRGMETIDIDNELVIYPNPADDHLNLEFPFTDGDVLITVVNPLGQTVLKQNVTSVDDAVQLNIQCLSEGLYFITVKNGDNSFTARFIKK